jgi:hypothetical protein
MMVENRTDATTGGNHGDRSGEVWLGRGWDRRWLETGPKRPMEIELARRGMEAIGGGERPWRYFLNLVDVDWGGRGRGSGQRLGMEEDASIVRLGRYRFD